MSILLAIFFGAVGIQLLYLIVYLIAFQRARQDKPPIPVPVSVLVCAHDEEENLKALLPLLKEQDHPEFEIIVINDRSNDDTYDFLLEQSKADTRIRMVNVERVPAHVNGKKFGITLGIKAAAHEWILLVDADCRPAHNRWISAMSRHFDDKTKIVLGFSPYIKASGFLNLFGRFESIITAMQYFSFAIMRNAYMGVGRNLAYRKSLFLEKKGFNQFLNVTGGDDDLFVNQHADKTNTAVEFSEDAHVLSVGKTSWRSFFYQKVRHLAVGKRYRLKHRILLGIFAVAWMLTWFVGVPLLIADITYWPVTAVFAVRIIFLMIVIKVVASNLKVKFEVWALPFLDFVYSIYYISTGLVALLTKKIRWRK